jgi:predicted O-methyltransferase YrrM
VKASELFFKLKPKWESYDLKKAEPYLKGLSPGARNDIENKKEIGYYQFLPVLVDHLKPEMVVELGGAMGASTLMMLSSLPKGSCLWSITLPEGGLEYSFVKENYQNFVPIVGNDLSLKSWPKEVKLEKTDIWFIDTEHTYQQLSSELKLYKKFFKSGAVILIDDIKLNQGMYKAWLEFPGDKFDASTWLHWSGFGIIVI